MSNPYNSKPDRRLLRIEERFGHFGGSRRSFHAKMALRKVNKPVIKKYIRKVALKKKNQNQSAIMTLSRQVKKLQMSQYGSKQYQMQSFKLQTNHAPSNVSPKAFMANCFYAQGGAGGGTPIYSGFVTPGPVPGTGVPGAVEINSFKKAEFGDALDDLDGQYQWNEYNNSNQVSAIRYMPVYAVYRFRIASSLLQEDLPHRYRITFLKIKSPYLNSSSRSYTALPSNLGAYWRMIENDVTERNYFSPRLHTIIADRFITVHPPPGVTQDGEAYVRKATIKLSFDKLMTPNFLNTSEVPNQNMWTNTPIQDQIWCIISSAQGLDNGAEIQCTRSICWRDPHGVSTT